MAKMKHAAANLAICAAVGGAISYFSPVKWVVASLLIFAAFLLNGTVAMIEDGLPGGFENPDRLASSTKSLRNWCVVAADLVIAATAAGAGAYIQYG
jgi:hypothetical protein